jgi:hypothetical protein
MTKIKTINLIIKVDSENNKIAVAERSKMELEGIDRIMFMIGVYNHLLNKEVSKIQKKKNLQID